MLRRLLLSGITTFAVVAAVSGGLAASSSGESAVAGTTVGAATVDKSAGTSADALAAAERSRQVAAVEQAAASRTKAAVTAAAAKKAAAVRERAAERRVTAARASRSRDRARLAAQNPQVSARSQAAARGWGAGQFSCLDSLWTKESGWKHTADNPTSSAFGIPQALPGSKMASAGSDWRTNPVTQIRWGLGYIDSRYGTPCAAWQHSQSNNWY